MLYNYENGKIAIYLVSLVCVRGDNKLKTRGLLFSSLLPYFRIVWMTLFDSVTRVSSQMGFPHTYSFQYNRQITDLYVIKLASNKMYTEGEKKRSNYSYLDMKGFSTIVLNFHMTCLIKETWGCFIVKSRYPSQSRTFNECESMLNDRWPLKRSRKLPAKLVFGVWALHHLSIRSSWLSS